MIQRYKLRPDFLLVASLFAASSTLAAPIDIPLNTWVARPVPAVGEGPSGGMKHIRIAHNGGHKTDSNGRLYFSGGDYSGPEFFGSGRNEVYSYSIEDNDWRLEHPYCPEDGDYQPAGPDQVGWVYDSRRNLFWMTPGYTSPGSRRNCNEGNTWKGTLGNTLMAFNPVTKKWMHDPEKPRTLPSNATPSIRKFAHYDPVTDTIIRFGQGGARVEIYDIENDEWTLKNLPSDIAEAFLGWDYTALDVVGRAIYTVAVFKDKLIRYDIDTQTAAYVSDLPTGNALQIKAK